MTAVTIPSGEYVAAVDAAGDLADPAERELAEKLRRQINTVTLTTERAKALAKAARDNQEQLAARAAEAATADQPHDQV